MEQFDILINNNSDSADTVPYLINLQSDPMEILATRIVAPLRRSLNYSNQKISRIHPEYTLKDETYILFLSEMAAIPSSLIGEKAGNASEIRTDIINALDLLFTGF